MENLKMWLIATSSGRPIQDIARDLEKAGLVDVKVLEEIECISGSANEKIVNKLLEVPGVIDLTPDTPVDIGTPDADITW